jgi:hypothetical protein
VMDTYALEKLSGWTPDLSPPPNSPLYRWRELAGEAGGGSNANSAANPSLARGEG